MRNSCLLLQGLICGTDRLYRTTFSVPIEFLSNQRLKGQDHFNIEGHDHPPLSSAAVRRPIEILLSHSLNSFEEQHDSLLDSEKEELKLDRKENVVVSQTRSRKKEEKKPMWTQELRNDFIDITVGSDHFKTKLIFRNVQC